MNKKRIVVGISGAMDITSKIEIQKCPNFIKSIVSENNLKLKNHGNKKIILRNCTLSFLRK